MRKIFFLLLFIILFLFSGCNKECREDTDCYLDAPCVSAVCDKGVCERSFIDACCGNQECEEAQEENPCSCPADCTTQSETGACEGKVRWPNPDRDDRFITADHAEYYCEDRECLIGVPSESEQQKQLFSEHAGTISFELVSTISQPFTIGKGSFTIKLTLTDFDDTKVETPIIITSIKVLSGNELIGEEQLREQLNEVGVTYEKAINLNPSLATLEDERPLSVRISYEYDELRSDGSTELERLTLESRYNNFIFIDPSKVPS